MDYIWTLVSKKLANEASENELIELNNLLTQHPDIRKAVNLFFEWWNLSNREVDLNESRNAFSKIKKKLK
ncbi:hypothetical protein HDF22_004878 [Mucilaginibacter lappiensis]|uniref:Uncharacterized protein n=1 Tax=Mucilaginibacter lappiensis TaxID=354630 RepID=A0A841JHT9_9SPHI|nr:hypothetical protein [Mucilaginibacter lappiensis]